MSRGTVGSVGDEPGAGDVGEVRRPLFDQVLDYAVFAPVGAAVRIAEDLPGLVDKGRARLGGQIASARVLGRFAVGTARQRAGALLDPLTGPLNALVRQLVGERGPEETVEPMEPTPPDTTSPPSGARDGEARSGAAARDRGPSPSVEDLAVPGYDSLAASQVVPRLGGLADEELADVRRYEETHRARRTILGRIAQLEAAGARDGRD